MTIPSYRRVKPLLDHTLATLLLAVLWPVLFLVGLAIVLDSRGPAVYRQTRVGRRGKPFTILKFRTMKTGTPTLSTAEMQSQKAKPFTRLGPLLRRTNLDELPQLVNIVRGEMSFVGPRPALPSQYDVNTLRAATGANRATPGITGLAQVMGRDDLENLIKVGYDADYTRDISFKHDVHILVRTVGAVLSARGNK